MRGAGSAGAAVDVAIVGGGIVGCATAAFLAEAGAWVLVVESVGIAAAASGRNSGVVQHPFDAPLAALYRETVALLRDLEGIAADDFALPPAPAGLLYVSTEPAAALALATALLASHPEVEPAYLDPDALGRLEPGLEPGVAACSLAIGYPVGPGRATRAWAEVAARRGAEILIGEAAALERVGDTVVGVRVGGEFRAAGSVVVAAGPWTPALVDPTGAWRPIRPLWGAVVEIDLTSPPRHVLEELEIDTTIEPERSRPAESAGDVPVAFSLVTADGRSVLGSSFSAHEPDHAALVPVLIERARRFLPAVAQATVRGSRQCARPLSFDGRPLVGAVPAVDRLFVAAGHGPWGISTGAASARLVADLVLGRVAAPPAALDPARYLGVAESR